MENVRGYSLKKTKGNPKKRGPTQPKDKTEANPRKLPHEPSSLPTEAL